MAGYRGDNFIPHVHAALPIHAARAARSRGGQGGRREAILQVFRQWWARPLRSAPMWSAVLPYRCVGVGLGMAAYGELLIVVDRGLVFCRSLCMCSTSPTWRAGVAATSSASCAGKTAIRA